MNRDHIVELFVETAINAGNLILSHYGSEIEVSTKADGSPVSRVDKLAEELVLSSLDQFSTKLPIVAEESVAKSGIPTVGANYILVDPIDGTREYIAGSGEFTVNLALIENGVPVCGVVHLPTFKELYWCDGTNSFKGTVKDNVLVGKAQISVRMAPKNGILAMISRSHSKVETGKFLEQLAVDRIERAGSSLKFCRLAAGRADLYPRFSNTMFWDVAAGDAILRGAGGKVISTAGKELTYHLPSSPKLGNLTNSCFLAVGDQEILNQYSETVNSWFGDKQSG